MVPSALVICGLKSAKLSLRSHLLLVDPRLLSRAAFFWENLEKRTFFDVTVVMQVLVGDETGKKTFYSRLALCFGLALRFCFTFLILLLGATCSLLLLPSSGTGAVLGVKEGTFGPLCART